MPRWRLRRRSRTPPKPPLRPARAPSRCWAASASRGTTHCIAITSEHSGSTRSAAMDRGNARSSQPPCSTSGARSDVSEVGTSSESASEGARLLGVDAARGVALLGMMAVHVLPLVDPDGSASGSFLVAGGRSAALFAVLAGVGLALASGGTCPPRGRAWAAAGLGTLVRAGLIAAIGLVVGMAQSGIAVILVYYGLLFVLAIPLLPLRPWVLASLAAAVAIVVPVLSHLLRPELDPPDRGNPTLTTLLTDPAATLETLLITGYYPVLAWMTYVCAGLAVGRLQLRAKATA